MRVDWKDAGMDWEAQGAPFRVLRDERTGKEGIATETSIWNAYFAKEFMIPQGTLHPLTDGHMAMCCGKRTSQ